MCAKKQQKNKTHVAEIAFLQLLPFKSHARSLFLKYNVYYSQIDKHYCIDFHMVKCNEPTTSLLDIF